MNPVNMGRTKLVITAAEILAHIRGERADYTRSDRPTAGGRPRVYGPNCQCHGDRPHHAAGLCQSEYNARRNARLREARRIKREGI